MSFKQSDTHIYANTNKLYIFIFFSDIPTCFPTIFFFFVTDSLTQTCTDRALFYLSILLYSIHLPPHQTNFHSVWICVIDGALRGVEATFTSLEQGWRVVSTSPLLHTNTHTKVPVPRFSTRLRQPRRNPMVRLTSIRFCYTAATEATKSLCPKQRITPQRCFFFCQSRGYKTVGSRNEPLNETASNPYCQFRIFNFQPYTDG